MPLIASRARAALARTGRRSRARSAAAAGGLAIMSALAAVTGTSNAGAAILAAPSGAHGLTAQAAAPANILTAPTRVSHTADGTVGYREIGTGSPLLLIMGYAGSLDNWAPDFVDELAQAHMVVMLDNSGVGQTSRVPGTLTIDAMANQTSALLTALHLGPVSVLGWSMGGMTAQALAVLHPSQVSKLVLAATQVGNGKARPVPASAAAELASPDPRVVLSALFPPGQAAAERAYGLGILAYANVYSPPSGRAAGSKQRGHPVDRGQGSGRSGGLTNPRPRARRRRDHGRPRPGPERQPASCCDQRRKGTPLSRRRARVLVPGLYGVRQRGQCFSGLTGPTAEAQRGEAIIGTLDSVALT